MDFIEGRKLPLKVDGIPVGWATLKTNKKGDRLVVVWEAGEAELPFPVFDYYQETND